MVDKWIVFGGWAIRPGILRPLFGDNALLIDSNELMTDLVKEGRLAAGWEEIIASRILPLVPGTPWGIAGWSTGTLCAYAAAGRLRPLCGMFISATPSFCRRPGFKHGWKPAALRAMRNELKSYPQRVLTMVYEQCGPGSGGFGPEFADNTLFRLSAGLSFLEQATLFPVARLSFPSLFLHGSSDVIIPPAAGKYFCDAAGGTFIEYEGPHAFFVNRHIDIIKLVNDLFLI